jgi:hypothetical protein
LDSTEEEACHNLLQEIVHMWVTTKGNSKVHKIKEDYKIQQQKIAKERSLRKVLKSQNNQQT